MHCKTMENWPFSRFVFFYYSIWRLSPKNNLRRFLGLGTLFSRPNRLRKRGKTTTINAKKACLSSCFSGQNPRLQTPSNFSVISRAELKELNGTHRFLQKSAAFCENLQFPAVFCENLRFLNAVVPRKSENQRKSANLAPFVHYIVCPF